LSQRMSDRGFNMVDNSGSADLIVQAQVKKFLFKEKNVLLSENGICESEVTFNVFDPKSKKRLTIDTSGQVSLPGVNVSQIVPKTMASCVDVIVTKLAETNLWNELML
jgi:protein involved in polysaccharide export with SLBB domain